jgi:hypothetical protein
MLASSKIYVLNPYPVSLASSRRDDGGILFLVGEINYLKKLLLANVTTPVDELVAGLQHILTQLVEGNIKHCPNPANIPNRSHQAMHYMVGHWV